MRWLFILLLLINTLYFGWQMRQPESSHVEVLPANVTRLRLLKEEDSSLLLPRNSQQQALSSAYEPWCQVISGITDEAVALELQDRLEQQGLTSVVAPVDEERVLAYELTLDRPAQPEAQQALIDNLLALGLKTEEVRVNNKPVYIIGRYGSRSELTRARNALIGLFEPGEYQVVSQEVLFEVWVETDSSVETGNKIREIEPFLNSAIKIAKKSCKGVASTGERD